MNNPTIEDSQLICCTTTVGSILDANRIATSLIGQSLAACVQVGSPIQSHYCWQGKTCCDTEYRLTIKSTRAVWPELLQAIQAIHPYDEPQIIAMPIEAASPGYQAWAEEQCRRSN